MSTTKTAKHKHTPGPWWHDDDGFVRADVGTSGDFVYSAPVADPHATKDIDPDEREANAHLIAAAPDLLAACETLVAIESGTTGRCGYCGQHHTKYEDKCPVGMARAAIAKARGGA